MGCVDWGGEVWACIDSFSPWIDSDMHGMTGEGGGGEGGEGCSRGGCWGGGGGRRGMKRC